MLEIPAKVQPSIVVTNVTKVPRIYGPRLLMPGVPTSVDRAFLQSFGTEDKSLRYDFTDALSLLRSYTDDGDIQIDFRSILSMGDGYGRLAVWLIRALIAKGISVNVHNVGWVTADYIPDDINQMKVRALTTLPSRINLSMTLGYDPQLAGVNSPVKLGLTMFETDKLPRVHVSNVNQLDHVIVPAKNARKIFRDSGVRTEISVMRPGIPAADFPYQERPKNGLFKVLVLGALTQRKNAVGAVRIFKAASQGNPDWRLTIKTRMRDQADGVHEEAGDDPRIRFVSSDDAPNQVTRWYYSHDCFLWPSKGEGLGLPPLEALCTGMELVTADHSGMADYVSEEICYPIITAGKESAVTKDGFNFRYEQAYGEVGNWWVPDEAHAARQLRRCFNRWRAGRGLGQHASRVMAEKFPMSGSADDVIAVLREYV